MSRLRVPLALVGAVSVFFLPPWLPLICILTLALLYRSGEAIAIGLLLDLLWFAPHADGAAFFHAFPLYTLLAIVAVWLFEPLRLEFMK